LENLAKLDNKQFLRPIMDCKTRWNSTFKMINRACILKENIQMLLVKHPKLKDIFPSEYEWELFSDLDQFLYQFNEATIELLSQKYSIITHSRVILLAIKKDLEINYDNDYLLNDVFKTISKYKKYCFPKMISYEIQSPIRSLLEQQQQGVPIISTKKVSSFLKKLKGATSNIINENDKVHKYWISAEAEEDVEL
ncbi:12553_t:CDS:2, partial [Funneliformis geosporum]